MEELGRKLLEERQSKGISLQEISKATHISVGVLKDIEAGRFTKYKGDEQYIKMYLKKYANYLNIDAAQYVDSYVTLTREINLKEIQEEEDRSSKLLKDVTPKVSLSKPKYAQTRKVYENRFGVKYLKYGIIGILFLLIIISIWYGINLSKEPSSDFRDPSNTHISGETNTGEKDEPIENNPVVDEPVIENPIKITRNSEYNYNVVIPSDQKEFTMKFEFVSKTWSELKVNNKVYPEFISRIYNPNSKNTPEDSPEVIELTFNTDEVETIVLRNGNNLYHRYYINDEMVDLSMENAVANATNIVFNFVKE